MSSATWCTSRTSPASTIRPTFIRFWLRMRWWWIAETISRLGIGRELAVRVAVGEHDELGAAGDGLVDLLPHRGDPLLERALAVLDAVEAADDGRRRAAGVRVDVDELRELVVVDHREVEDHLAGVPRGGGEQVALRAEAEPQRGDDLLADESSGGFVTCANCCVK